MAKIYQRYSLYYLYRIIITLITNKYYLCIINKILNIINYHYHIGLKKTDTKLKNPFKHVKIRHNKSAFFTSLIIYILYYLYLLNIHICDILLKV